LVGTSAFAILNIEAVITVGSWPSGIAITPDGRYAYVCNGDDGTVGIINISTNTVENTVTVGSDPSDIAITPNGRYAYVCNYGSGTVSAINISTNIVENTVTVGFRPRDIAITPDGRYAYVCIFDIFPAGDGSGTVSMINISTNTIENTVTVGSWPHGIAITPDGKYAYVGNGSDDTVSVINVSTNIVENTVPVGDGPSGIAITPDGKYAYVCNEGDDTVSVMNVSTNIVENTVTVGANPYDIAITPDGRYACVCIWGAGTVSVINISTNTVEDTVTVGSTPLGIAITPDGKYAYVCNGSTVSVISGIMSGWTLNMTTMNWYQNIAPYNSTGAATCQMILNYIREGARAPLLTQDEIYVYARNPEPSNGAWLTPDEIDKALGHFDPYDSLVSNGYDGYDSLLGGNPYQGYNYTIHTYDPQDLNGMTDYMRDICHWMAYTVTQENWWDPDGALVARPNTPAALPIYGSYANWVAVKGCVTSENPVPDPRGNPWGSPDFTVYGFWMKDPQVTGIGQNTYKTAEECASTYFLPLATGDAYDGLLLQIAEPPEAMDTNEGRVQSGKVTIKKYSEVVEKNQANLAVASVRLLNVPAEKSWRDLVPQALLNDAEVVKAFSGTEMGKPILVRRTDDDNLSYYLVPFGLYSDSSFLSTGVVITDADTSYFKEASWTREPEKFLRVNEERAIYLVKRKLKLTTTTSSSISTELVWEPNSYSPSPYKPYWAVNVNGRIWYVTQDERIIAKTKTPIVHKELIAY
jgi:YVTN family beta-propeller protein